MSELLEHIDSPADLNRLDRQHLSQLAQEIRALISSTVAKTGGHLASNLGVVELSLALHYCFDFRYDRLVWDVGHQCYTHKLLTGRQKETSMKPWCVGPSPPTTPARSIARTTGKFCRATS